jgi:hypothetical protein
MDKQSAGIGKGTPGPGRKKGIPNKVNGALKDMILQALHGAGGVEYLQTQAEANPAAFMALVGKVLPMTVTGPAEDGSHKVVFSWQSAGS